MQMHDTGTKHLLPIHTIVCASDFAKTRMEICPREARVSEPFVEQTKIGWVIMSPDGEIDIVSALFTKTFVNDYEKLCDTDVLGLQR